MLSGLFSQLDSLTGIEGTFGVSILRNELLLMKKLISHSTYVIPCGAVYRHYCCYTTWT